jgi:hypothetical protein
MVQHLNTGFEMEHGEFEEKFVFQEVISTVFHKFAKLPFQTFLLLIFIFSGADLISNY